MKNTVTAGDYKGGQVEMSVKLTKDKAIYIIKPQGFFISLGKLLLAICTIGIAIPFFKSRKVFINKQSVESYEVLGEESQISASSAVTRGAIGAALLGPVGLAAALTAKKKGIHTVAIQFKDGKKSMIELDDAIYKAFVQNAF